MLTSVYVLTGAELLAVAVIAVLVGAALAIAIPLSLGAIEDGP